MKINLYSDFFTTNEKELNVSKDLKNIYLGLGEDEQYIDIPIIEDREMGDL